MTLYENSIQSGHWLFRWRSYVPLLFLLILIPSFWDESYINDSHTYDLALELIAFSISLFGLIIRVITIGFVPKGTSGRNTKEGQVAETLNTTGIYSITRNPLYVGNFFMMYGAVMFANNIWANMLFILFFWLYYERIIFAEESFLLKKFGKEYEEYANTTPVFIPRFSLWKKSDLTFSLKNVLKREYTGLYGIIVLFTLMEALRNYIAIGEVKIDDVWFSIFITGTFIYGVLKSLKKFTKVLDVKGR